MHKYEYLIFTWVRVLVHEYEYLPMIYSKIKINDNYQQNPLEQILNLSKYTFIQENEVWVYNL